MLSFSLAKLPKCVTTDKEHLKCYQNRSICVRYEKYNRWYGYFGCPKIYGNGKQKKAKRQLSYKGSAWTSWENYPGPLITKIEMLDKIYCLMKQRFGEFSQPHPSFSCFKYIRWISYSQRSSEMDKICQQIKKPYLCVEILSQKGIKD